MSRRGSLLAGLALGASAVGAALLWRSAPAEPTPPQAKKESGPEIVRFLADIDLSDPTTRPVLVLSDMATGGLGRRAITDIEALRHAQKAGVYFTNTPGAETRLRLLSLLFLSPAANTSAPFAEIYRKGRLIAHFDCFKLHCAGSGQYGATHRRDLGTLLNVARQTNFASETFSEASSARTAMARANADPEVFGVSISPTPPRASAPQLERNVTITLPLQIIEMPESGIDAAVNAFKTEYSKAFAKRFADSVYGDFTLSHWISDASVGWPIVRRDTGAALRAADDSTLDLSGLTVLDFQVNLRTDSMLADRLGSDGALDGLPGAYREPDWLKARVQALGDAATDTRCPDCYALEITPHFDRPSGDSGHPEITQRSITYLLSYERILP